MRLTPLQTFGAACLFLAGSAAAAGLAQFAASPVAPWISVVYSVIAIACTVAAVRMSRPR